MLPEDYHAP